jgi:hypothetical protein
MKKYRLLFTVFLAFLAFELSAQRWTRERNHLILGMGATGFMGDLGGADDIGTQGMRDFNFGAVRPGATLAYRYHLLEYVAVKGNLAFGYVYGDDRLTEEPFRNNRNIHFRSPIFETSVHGEYYIWSQDRVGARYRRITRSMGWIGYRFKVYLFGGVGGFYFNPQGYFEAASYTGEIPEGGLPADGWYNLRSLRTEGQGYFPTRDRYSRFQVTIPYGVGVTFSLSPDLSIGMEYGFRRTFTDYIDDVSTTYVDPAVFGEIFENPQTVFLARYFANPTINSLSSSVTAPGQQRGNPHNNDAYMFLFVTLAYKFPEARVIGRIPGL